MVEFELGNYGSGRWLEPLQLSGNYKTTSGLGFNCLFILKLIHPQTYSFLYFFLMKERTQVISTRVCSLIASQSLGRRHWTDAQRRLGRSYPSMTLKFGLVAQARRRNFRFGTLQHFNQLYYSTSATVTKSEWRAKPFFWPITFWPCISAHSQGTAHIIVDSNDWLLVWVLLRPQNCTVSKTITDIAYPISTINPYQQKQTILPIIDNIG